MLQPRLSRQSRKPCAAPPAGCFHTFQEQEKATQHREPGEQVGSPNNVGDRFRQHRMRRPQHGDEERRRKRPDPPGHQTECQRESRNTLAHAVKNDPVVPGRTIAVFQNRVIQKIGERGEGPVQTLSPCGTVRVPRIRSMLAALAVRMRVSPRSRFGCPARIRLKRNWSTRAPSTARAPTPREIIPPRIARIRSRNRRRSIRGLRRDGHEAPLPLHRVSS